MARVVRRLDPRRPRVGVRADRAEADLRANRRDVAVVGRARDIHLTVDRDRRGADRLVDGLRILQYRVPDDEVRRGRHFVRVRGRVARTVERTHDVVHELPVHGGRVREGRAVHRRVVHLHIAATGHRALVDVVRGGTVDAVPVQRHLPRSSLGHEPSWRSGRRQVDLPRREHDAAHRRHRHTELAAVHGPAACAGDRVERRSIRDVSRDRDVNRLRRPRSIYGDDRRLIRRLPSECDGARRVVGQQHSEVARRQRRNRPPERGEALVPVELPAVRAPAQIGPRIRAPVVRVVAAREADLVAVVHRRRAGKRELDERSEPEPLLAGREVRRVLLLVGTRICARRHRPQQPCRVVAVEQVHRRGVGRRGIVLLHRREPRAELRRGDRVTAVREPLRVERPRCQEAEHGIPQPVVHGRVEPVAAEDAQEGRVLLPRLADRQRVRIDLLDRLPHLLPVTGRERRIAGDVEPPT